MATLVNRMLRAEAEQLHALLTVTMEPSGNEPPSVEELMERIAAKQATANAFCATGDGSGIDASCSPGGTAASALKKIHGNVASASYDDIDAVVGELSKMKFPELQAVVTTEYGRSLGKNKKDVLDTLRNELRELKLVTERTDFTFGVKNEREAVFNAEIDALRTEHGLTDDEVEVLREQYLTE